LKVKRRTECYSGVHSIECTPYEIFKFEGGKELLSEQEYNKILREYSTDARRTALREHREHKLRANIGDIVYFADSDTYELVTSVRTTETYDGKDFESITQLVETTNREYTRNLTIPKLNT